MKMFVILITVMVSQVYTYVKTHQIGHINMCSVVYVKLHIIKVVKYEKKDRADNNVEDEVKEKRLGTRN